MDHKLSLNVSSSTSSYHRYKPFSFVPYQTADHNSFRVFWDLLITVPPNLHKIFGKTYWKKQIDMWCPLRVWSVQYVNNHYRCIFDDATTVAYFVQKLLKSHPYLKIDEVTRQEFY